MPGSRHGRCRRRCRARPFRYHGTGGRPPSRLHHKLSGTRQFSLAFPSGCLGCVQRGRQSGPSPAKEMKDMRHLLALPLVAAVACAGGTFKDQARAAMPTSDTVSMGSPNSSAQALAASSGTTVTQNSTAGDASAFARMTATVAIVFNVPTAAFLGLLRHVVEDYNPTSCDATSCTWGPGSAPLDLVDYKLVVSHDADGISFDWVLSGAIKPGTNFV